MKDAGGEQSLILVLNSGSSSLKFGVYCRGTGDEQVLLASSADGIGRRDGSLQIHFPDGQTALRRQDVLESQENALAAVAEAVQIGRASCRERV